MSEQPPEVKITIRPPEDQPNPKLARAAHKLRAKSATVGDDIPNVDDELPEDYETYAGAPESRSDIPPGRESFVERPEKIQKDDNKAKAGIPTVAEWQDFIGRTVLRFMTDGYLTLALRDIEHLLTDRERELIRLSKQDLTDLAAPMAELANKSSIMRKRGRLIVASADSVEAVWTLVFWMRRVQRIAKRHHIQMRQEAAQQSTRYIRPEDVINANGHLRKDQGQGNATQPDEGIGPTLYNPGTG